MGAQNNDINRTVDGDVAEGHARALIGEAEELRTRKMVAKKAATKRAATVDEEAEGHVRALIGEGEEVRTRKLVAKKAPNKNVRVDESEAEGHAVLRSPDRPTELRQIARRAKATMDDASEGHLRTP